MAEPDQTGSLRTHDTTPRAMLPRLAIRRAGHNGVWYLQNELLIVVS